MPATKSKSLADLHAAKLQFIEPMYALAASELPQGDKWLFEVKLDGYDANPSDLVRAAKELAKNPKLRAHAE